MENQKTKTVRLSTVILLFIILILVVALVLMYMYYNSDSKNEIATNTNKPESMNTTKTTDEEESDRKELSVTSSTVKELYKYIPAENDYYTEENEEVPNVNAYQSKKVTIDDLADELILGHAFLNTEIPIDERIPYEEEVPVTDWYKAKPDRLQETLLKMYNTEIEDKSFYIEYSYGNYENGIYTFTFGGGGNEGVGYTQNIEEAYEKNDELYIIDTYLMYTEKYGVDEDVSFKIYDSSDSNKPIEEDSVEKRDNLNYEKYLSKSKKYKHTFRKNDDGEYYWYSSEPYNEE